MLVLSVVIPAQPLFDRGAHYCPTKFLIPTNSGELPLPLGEGGVREPRQ